jgi:hypothetical protein
MGKNTPKISTKIPNDHKIYQNGNKKYQVATKYTKVYHFWFESMPFGNPALG